MSAQKSAAPRRSEGRHSRLRVPNCDERLVSDIERSRIQEVSRPASGVVRIGDLSGTSTTLNGRWRRADAGRVIAGARPDMMAAATSRQKAYGCQNEEQAIHVEFPRAFAGTALGRLGVIRSSVKVQEPIARTESSPSVFAGQVH